MTGEDAGSRPTPGDDANSRSTPGDDASSRSTPGDDTAPSTDRDGQSALHRRDVGAVAAVLVLALLARILGPVAIPGANAVASLGAGVAFAAGLALGPIGALAATLGHAGTGLVDGLGGGGVLAIGTVGLVAALFRADSGLVASDGELRPPSGGSLAPTVGVASLAVAAATAVTAATTTLVDGVPFYLVVATVGTAIVAGVALGLALLAGIAVVRDRVGDRVEDPSEIDSPDIPGTDSERTGQLAAVQAIESPWSKTSLAVLAVAWLVVGSVLDLGFTLARTVPAAFYRSRLGVEVSTPLFNRLQLLAHGLVVVVVLAVLWRRAPPDAGVGDDAGGDGGTGDGGAGDDVADDVTDEAVRDDAAGDEVAGDDAGTDDEPAADDAGTGDAATTPLGARVREWIR